MTPAARLAAAIEVLDRLAGGGAPDRVLKAWGAHNRYAGSSDRRAVAERVFACLRQRGGLAAAMGAEDGRAMVLASLGLIDRLAADDIARLFSGQPHAPAPLTPQEQARIAALDQGDGLGLPDALAIQFDAAFGADWPAEASALLRGRAPLDLRVNTARAAVDQVEALLARAGVGCARTPWSAAGLRIEGAPDLASTPAFAEGLFEVQDEGSQMAAFLAGGGDLIVDYCAGGGGKTLALAAAAGDEPKIVACDVDQRRLDAIAPRLARAGVQAELRRLGHDGRGAEDLEGRADLVLVDAPCSGSGTWRRRPETAWTLTAEALAGLSSLQSGILARAARLVRPGGRLAYVTCSVLPAENRQVAQAFAAAHAGFAPMSIVRAAETAALTDAARRRLAALSGGGHTVQLSPRRTDTDGFFVALFERTA